MSGGTLTLKSLTVSGGSIENMGGGALNDQGTLNLDDTVFKDNRAVTGGGLYNNGGRLDLDRSTVERNTADGFGGGVVNDFGGTMTMKRGPLLKNGRPSTMVTVWRTSWVRPPEPRRGHEPLTATTKKGGREPDRGTAGRRQVFSIVREDTCRKAVAAVGRSGVKGELWIRSRRNC